MALLVLLAVLAIATCGVRAIAHRDAAGGRAVRAGLAKVAHRDTLVAGTKQDAALVTTQAERAIDRSLATDTRASDARDRQRRVRGGLRVAGHVITTAPDPGDPTGHVDTLSTAPQLADALLTADTALAIADTARAQLAAAVDTTQQALERTADVVAQQDTAIAQRDVLIEHLDGPRCRTKCKVAAAGAATVIAAVVLVRVTGWLIRRTLPRS